MQSQFPYPQSPQSSPRSTSPLDELKPDPKVQGTGTAAQGLADAAQSAIARVAEKTTPIVEKIADSTKAVVDSTVSTLRTAGGDSIDSFRTYVRGRPFTALVAAALLGAVVSGALSSRSRSHLG